MTKEQLAKLGITKEGITEDEIIDLILQERKSSKDENDKLKLENEKSKNLISTRNSEIAELKEKVNGGKSEAEKHKEYVAELEKHNKDLEAKIKIGEIKSKFLSLGYDEDEAKKIADASIEGKYELVAKYTDEHQKKKEAELRAELLKQTPPPNPDGKGTGGNELYTKENFKKGKISYEALCKLQTENPKLFDEITK